MSTRNTYKLMLGEAEKELRHRFGLGVNEAIDTAIVLGTGWGDAFAFNATHTAPMREMGGFNGLEELEGHARRFELGTVMVNDRPKRVIVQRGRIHMNEDTFEPGPMRQMIRLQIEVLIRLGVKKFVLTCAAGALWNASQLAAGDIVIADNFPSWGNETFPLFPGEFGEPAMALNTQLIEQMRDYESQQAPRLRIGGYVFFRGPHFEGRKSDKPRMQKIGGAAVGMSLKPECAILMLHEGVTACGLIYISNDSKEEPDHEEHRDRAKRDASHLAATLKLVLHAWA